VKISQLLKKYWYLVVTILLSILLIPLLQENLLKVLLILGVIVLWNILGIAFRDFTKASFLILLLILPFNVTYQLPYSMLGLELANPFVDGVIVNYLIPTLSILDLGVFLLLLSLIFKEKIDSDWKGFSFLKIFVIFAAYLILQSVFKGSFLSVLNSFRFLLYIFTFYNLFKNREEVLEKKFLIYVLILSILLVLLQGIIAFSQFRGGTSVGWSFLGESQVVSGMRGSSFVTLKDQLFLRGYGFFPHPNIFSGWLIFNILLGWYLFENMLKNRDLSVILMLLSSLFLLLTFSRISFLICTLVWSAFLVKVFVKSRNRNFGFIGLISERFVNLFAGGDTSWSDRVGLMRASFNIIKENILTGVGLGRFIPNMGDTVPRSGNGILLLQPVHNIFLLILSEIGLIGFGLFSSLLYFFFRGRKWGLRLILSLVAIVIIGMFDHYLNSLPQGLVVFLLILTI
jgi:O-antigen ligase